MKVLTAFVSMGLLLSACQPTATPAAPAATSAPGEPTTVPMMELEGEVLVDGSSTVFPISEKVADEFSNVHPKVEVPVGESGTGGGFKKFCNDEIDIADASRPIKDSEKEACDAAGIEYFEFLVGTDALAIIVHPETEFVTCLTFDQLKLIWAPESEEVVTNWNQVDPAFPDAELTLFGPGADSGTYDYFNEAVLGTNAEGKVITPRTDYQPSEDDNVLVQGVSGEPNALGFFGLAYYANNADKLKLLTVDKAGDGSCAEATEENVLNGSYPLARPLFIYVKKASLARPEVYAFVEFYLANAEEYVKEVGYVSLPAADYVKVQADLAAAKP